MPNVSANSKTHTHTKTKAKKKRNNFLLRGVQSQHGKNGQYEGYGSELYKILRRATWVRGEDRGKIPRLDKAQKLSCKERSKIPGGRGHENSVLLVSFKEMSNNGRHFVEELPREPWMFKRQDSKVLSPALNSYPASATGATAFLQRESWVPSLRNRMKVDLLQLNGEPCLLTHRPGTSRGRVWAQGGLKQQRPVIPRSPHSPHRGLSALPCGQAPPAPRCSPSLPRHNAQVRKLQVRTLPSHLCCYDSQPGDCSLPSWALELTPLIHWRPRVIF